MQLPRDRSYKPTQRKHVLGIWALRLLVVFLALLATVNVAVFFMPPAISYPSLPISLGVRTVKAGSESTLYATTLRCANDPFEINPLTVDYQTRIISVVNDQEVAELPESFIYIEPGCHITVNPNAVVPQWLDPGTYYLEGTSTATGRWKTSTAEWYTETFTVEP